MISVMTLVLMMVMGFSLIGIATTGFGDEPSQKLLDDIGEMISRKRK